MSITNELREYATVSWDPWPEARDRLLQMCDRIDAEHKRACDDAWDNGYEADYLGIEKWLTEHPQVMEHHGWIRLPKDAGGEYIRVGDMVTEHEDGHTFTVDGFMTWDDEWWVFQRDAIQAPARRCTHHKPPTVEDVLEELVVDWDCAEDGADKTAVLAEYAAKLQLKESE